MSEEMERFLRAQLAGEWVDLEPVAIDSMIDVLDALVSDGTIVIGRP